VSGARENPEDDANAKARSGTRSSYGGTPDMRRASGNVDRTRCAPGLRGDIHSAH